MLDEGKSVGAVARELDLTASALGDWVKHARADRTKGKSGLMKEEREEFARLRKDLRILAEEREILKNLRAPVPRYLLDQKLPGRLSSRHPGRSGRLLFGDVREPVKKHGPGVACALDIGDAEVHPRRSRLGK